MQKKNGLIGYCFHDVRKVERGTMKKGFLTKMIAMAGTLVLAFNAFGLDQPVLFDTSAPGEYKGLDIWGADTAWLSDVNVRRSVIFMGQPQTDVIRFSFTGDTPISGGNLTGTGITEFNQRMNIVNAYCDSHTALYLNNDTVSVDASYLGVNGVDAAAWAELIDATMRACTNAGRTVLCAEPFNEPDDPWGAYWQAEGNPSRLNQVCAELRGTYGANFSSIRLSGGSTLNPDNALYWYNTPNNGIGLEEGNTHQLAGTFDNYAAFYQTVQANGDLGANDELHNTMEAMVGAEYGMDVGIWWGTAERTRGEFVKASDGDRLGYAENRPNWTAASVYRTPTNTIQAFVGQSERQSNTGTYRFFCKDRPVFFDGHGPQRSYSVATTGNGIYGTFEGAIQPNSETVINISWGDDVQPAIDGQYYLINRNSHLAMTVAGNSTGDGANIRQQNFFSGDNQKWNVNPMPADSGGDYSCFTMNAVHSGKAADVVNFSFNDGGDVQQYGFGTYPNVNQQWYLEYAEDGWFYIRSRWSGKYLEVAGASTVTAANIRQNSHDSSTYGDDYHQQWRLLPVSAGDAFGVEFNAPAAPSNLVATANAVSVQLGWDANAEADLDGYTVLRSTTNGGPYDIIARGVTNNAYTDSSANQSITYYYVIEAVDQSLNRSAYSAQDSATPTGAPALVAHYAFDGDSIDSSINGNDSVVNGSANFVGGGLGTHNLLLDGNSGYVDLPAEVVNFDQLTVATWVLWYGGGNWQRIFDFGNGEEQYLFLSPSDDVGQMHFGMTTNGYGNEETLTADELPIGQWTHVALVLSNTTAMLYVDGTNVASSSSFTINPSDINPVLNYIGRSQFATDSMLSAAIDDFRVYNHALDGAAVAALAAVAPAPPGQTQISFQSTQPTLGPDDIAYLTSSSSSALNVGGGTLLASFIRHDRYNLGQSFTTGSNPDGYIMSGFWLRHVSYSSALEIRYDPGATLLLRVLETSGTTLTPLLAETYTMTQAEPGIGSMPNDGFNPVGTGTWIHFAFASPVALEPDTQYAFDVGTTATTPNFYVQSAGTSTNGYAGGAAYSTANKGDLDMGTVYPGDRSFVVELDSASLLPPEAPTGLAAVSDDAQVALSWNSVSNATSYAVKYSLNNGGPYSLVDTPAATNYVHTGLTNGTTYYYVASAIGTGGESTNSVQVSAVPSPSIASNEYHIAAYVLDGGTNISLTVSNSVPGHDYGMLAADVLTTNTAWSNILIQAGSGSDLLFGIPIEPGSTSRFFKLDVNRQ